MTKVLPGDEHTTPVLSELEQATVEFFHRFQDSIRNRNLEKIHDDLNQNSTDISLLKDQFVYIANSSIENAVLSGVAIADNFLKEMFQRENRAAIDMKTMLGPLGPLGDFQKRLMVAAIANYIDEYDLLFFNGLRKLRNKIAHATIPKPPDNNQINNLLKSLPNLIEMLQENGSMSFDSVQPPRNILRAMIVWQIAGLAWKTVAYPQLLKHGVPTSTFLKNPHKEFGKISRVAGEVVLTIFNGEFVSKTAR